MTEQDIDLEILTRLGVDLSRVDISRGNFLISCVNHEDKSPSMSISLIKHCYNCFSCGDSGTLKSLYYKHTGHGIMRDLDIQTSANYKSVFSRRTSEPIVSLKDPPETFIDFSGTRTSLKNSAISLKYLQHRGIPLKVAESMKMEYGRFCVTKNSKDLNNKKDWVYFNDRLLIPIYEGGKLLTIEGRDILGKEHFYEAIKKKGLNPDDITYKKVLYPKNSSTNTLFQFDRLRKDKTLYVTEGLMDLAVLRADTFFVNSTTVFGANISTRQQYLLGQFTEIVYIADHDKAGLISLHKLKNSMKTPFKYIFAPRGAKDIGDIPQVLNTTVADCRNRRWLASIKSSDSFDILKEAKASEFINDDDMRIITQAYC